MNSKTNTDNRIFDSVYRDYYTRVYNLCLRMGADSETSKDLTQEIFIKVYKRMESFREESSLSTWVYRISKNHCIDHFRKSKSLAEGFKKLVNGFIMGESSGSFEKEVVDRQEGIELLKKLTPKNRALLILKQYVGLNYKELAEVFETSSEAVGVMLSRARKAAGKAACEMKGGVIV